MSLKLRHECLRDGFDLWHVEDAPGPLKIHCITSVDEHYHDHTCHMVSYVAFGGHDEEVWTGDSTTEIHSRPVGSVYEISPDRIHRIVRLHDGPSWTVVKTGPIVRAPQLYRIEGGRLV